MTLTIITPPRIRAILCWPVEFFDNKKRDIPGPHVTALYFPDVVSLGYSKEDILSGLRSNMLTKSFSLADVDGIDAFGPENNIPVLRVSVSGNDILKYKIYHLRNTLDDIDIMADRSYTINPHVTVDLQTLVNPPKQVLLKPLELWYRDEEPVVV